MSKVKKIEITFYKTSSKHLLRTWSSSSSKRAIERLWLITQMRYFKYLIHFVFSWIKGSCESSLRIQFSSTSPCFCISICSRVLLVFSCLYPSPSSNVFFAIYPFSSAIASIKFFLITYPSQLRRCNFIKLGMVLLPVLLQFHREFLNVYFRVLLYLVLVWFLVFFLLLFWGLLLFFISCCCFQSVCEYAIRKEWKRYKKNIKFKMKSIWIIIHSSMVEWSFR